MHDIANIAFNCADEIAINMKKENKEKQLGNKNRFDYISLQLLSTLMLYKPFKIM